MSLASGTRLGPYEILAPLGAGGMGEVYRARDTRLDRTVAVKILPSHLSSDATLRQRFEHEAKAISSLNHPHICGLYDVGHQDGTYFLVMEYLEGEILAKLLGKAMPNSSFVMGAQQGGFALSPDGLRIAYVAQNADGKALLWVRALDSLQAQALKGTEEASFPFWSPDSQSIGFFASGKLKKVESSGGPLFTVCDAPNPRGGSWNQDGVILLTPNLNVPLHRVSASGGTPVPVTTLDPAKGITTHRWPQFLPDGHHFIYVAGTPLTPRENPTNAIMLGALDSKESKFLLRAHASGEYVSGHILFLRQSTLMAQRFDVRRLELTGDAFPIADPVQETELILRSMFSASENGPLTYLEGTSSTSRQLIWLDRSGKKVGEVPELDTYVSPRISPDGKRVLYTLIAPSYEVWSYDMVLGLKTRLTFGTSSGWELRRCPGRPALHNLLRTWSA